MANAKIGNNGNPHHHRRRHPTIPTFSLPPEFLPPLKSRQQNWQNRNQLKRRYAKKSVFQTNSFCRIISFGTFFPKQKANLRCFLHRITWVCTLGGFLFGYDTGVINGALPFMRRDFGLTDVTVGIVASSLLIGAAIGAFLSGKFADRFGRRRTLIVLSVSCQIGLGPIRID